MKKKTIAIRLGADQDRPIAMLVQVATKFDSNIHIESGNKFVNAKSIMGMMTLAVENGEELTVVANGSDEDEAISSMEAYLTGGADK
ncbi:MAG: HPr family phosphocarrier protein [Lachnospiraceae bacterium]|nr:HPr family phosphocarrier protein [Lachnospiraceae bacterium]